MLDEAEVLRSALESTPVGLYIVDRDRKILLWSEGAERVTGYLRQEVIGRSCRDNLLDHCGADGVRVCETACPLTTAIQNGRAIDRVLFLKHKNGHRVPVRVYANGLRNDHGHVIGAMETFYEQSIPKSDTATPNRSGGQFPTRVSDDSIPGHTLTLVILREVLSVAKAQSAPCAVVCLQLAHFHRFKTLHTLAAAEQMMDSIGASVKQILRQTDHIGRWSDEQFLIILPGCHASALEIVAKRISHVAHGSHIRWWGDELCASSWIAGVMAKPDEEPEAAAARAVTAAESCVKRTEQGNIVLIER
jgi:PAS domain S-box-containing protein